MAFLWLTMSVKRSKSPASALALPRESCPKQMKPTYPRHRQRSMRRRQTWPGTTTNVDLDVGQGETLVANHLAGHVGGWTHNQTPLGVDNVHNDGELTGIRAEVDKYNAAVLNKSSH